MADPYRYNPFGKGSEAWYNKTQDNNYSGYAPPQQKRLSDLLYQQPQQYQQAASRTYTNADFSQPQYYQQQEQPQTYTKYLPRSYETIEGGTKYMDEGTFGRYINAIDSNEDPYAKMDAYRNLMKGVY